LRFLLRAADAHDTLSRRLAQGLKWLALAVVLVQFIVVVLRYAYGSSFVWMQESVIYVHATLFMLAIGYTWLVDQHVRVDVFYAGWTVRRQAAVDLACVVLAALPFCALVVWASYDYAARSWMQNEGPMAVGGVPFVPALKSLIPLMGVLLGLQAVSLGIRCVAVLAGAAPTHFPYRQKQGGA
jgi:TRAP-type mannitol/chloroaromatic compound transport system permease small subunit